MDLHWFDIVGAFFLGALFGMWLERTYLKLKAIADINRGRPE